MTVGHALWSSSKINERGELLDVISNTNLSVFDAGSIEPCTTPAREIVTVGRFDITLLTSIGTFRMENWKVPDQRFFSDYSYKRFYPNIVEQVSYLSKTSIDRLELWLSYQDQILRGSQW